MLWSIGKTGTKNPRHRGMGEGKWRANLFLFAAVAGAVARIDHGNPAIAQKAGGILQPPHFDSPASMSLHEESTTAGAAPRDGRFQNLVVYDQHVAQNSMHRSWPDLATGWSWSGEGTELRLPLLQGVKWHTASPLPRRM